MERESRAAGADVARSRVAAWANALRPDQWVKNVVVFAAPVFSLRLLDPEALARAGAAFAVFCAASSAVYLLNDVADLTRDRAHPEKRRRPLAAGEISRAAALGVAAGLGAGAVAAGAAVAPGLAAAVAGYLALNVVYSLGAKHVPIVDVIAIALGYVLRAIAGAEAIGVVISHWLEICTFLVMLFLALGKRRAEVAGLEAAGVHRPAFEGYSVALLDQMITVVVAATVVSYCLYTVSPEVQHRLGVERLEATVPFVVYGLLRYLYLVRETAETANPTRVVLRDRAIVLAVLSWAALVIALLYVGRRA
jgi:4-hydroxybenzoate polyprenyltransferase